MQRLALDYLRPAWHSPWPGLTLLALAIFITATLMMEYRATADAIEAHNPEIVEVRRTPIDSTERLDALSPAEQLRLKQRIEQANRLIARMSLPWDALFNAMEQVQNNDIALLDIQPEALTRRLSVRGEARDFPALSSYLRRLQTHNQFANVFLVSHEIDNDDPQRPIRFEIKADWVVQ